MRDRGQTIVTCTRSQQQNSPSHSSERNLQSSPLTIPTINSDGAVTPNWLSKSRQWLPPGEESTDGVDESWPLPAQSNAPLTCNVKFTIRDPHKWSLPTSFLNISLESPLMKIFGQPAERKALQGLLERFDPLTSTCTSPDLSILSQGLPLAVEYPGVKAAFIACGLAILFRVSCSKEDHQSAIMYYNKAVNTVASHLMSFPAEANLSAVLLLHIFEVRDGHSEFLRNIDTTLGGDERHLSSGMGTYERRPKSCRVFLQNAAFKCASTSPARSLHLPCRDLQHLQR